MSLLLFCDLSRDVTIYYYYYYKRSLAVMSLLLLRVPIRDVTIFTRVPSLPRDVKLTPCLSSRIVALPGIPGRNVMHLHNVWS